MDTQQYEFMQKGAMLPCKNETRTESISKYVKHGYTLLTYYHNIGSWCDLVQIYCVVTSGGMITFTQCFNTKPDVYLNISFLIASMKISEITPHSYLNKSASLRHALLKAAW